MRLFFLKNYLPLPEDKKLLVTYHVESGCLGPEGKLHVSEFCRFAQKEFKAINSDYISLSIIPRSNKKAPEMQYNLINKTMNYSQAKQYLAVFGKCLDEFEGHLGDQLAALIDEFMER